MSNGLIQKNIRMSEKVAGYYENKAKEIGISQSALMVIALDQYIRSEKALEGVDVLKELHQQMKLAQSQDLEKE